MGRCERRNANTLPTGINSLQVARTCEWLTGPLALHDSVLARPPCGRARTGSFMTLLARGRGGEDPRRAGRRDVGGRDEEGVPVGGSA
jgi:hypothetical protein